MYMHVYVCINCVIQLFLRKPLNMIKGNGIVKVFAF